MYDACPNPKDVLRSIVVAPEAVQFIALDLENAGLAHGLIAQTLETAAHASAA